MINAEPEKQQGTQEESLEERIQRSWEPAVHQERQREEWIWNDEKHQTLTLEKYLEIGFLKMFLSSTGCSSCVLF